jgi:hypothetical protein
MKKNSSVGIGVVARNHDRSERAGAVELESKALPKPKLEYHIKVDHIVEKLAKHRVYYRNHQVSKLEAYFKFAPISCTVALFFPMAEGGPLYVDLPIFPYDVEVCRKKAAAFREMGMRYVFLQKGDALDVAWAQLEGKLK